MLFEEIKKRAREMMSAQMGVAWSLLQLHRLVAAFDHHFWPGPDLCAAILQLRSDRLLSEYQNIKISNTR